MYPLAAETFCRTLQFTLFIRITLSGPGNVVEFALYDVNDHYNEDEVHVYNFNSKLHVTQCKSEYIK